MRQEKYIWVLKVTFLLKSWIELATIPSYAVYFFYKLYFLCSLHLQKGNREKCGFGRSKPHFKNEWVIVDNERPLPPISPSPVNELSRVLCRFDHDGSDGFRCRGSTERKDQGHEGPGGGPSKVSHHEAADAHDPSGHQKAYRVGEGQCHAGALRKQSSSH